MAEYSSKIPSVHIADFEPVPPDIIALLPVGLVTKQNVVPLKKFNGRLIVAASKTEGVVKPEGLALVTGCPVELVVAPPEEISDFISRHYKGKPTRRMMTVPAELFVKDEKPIEPPDSPIHHEDVILQEAPTSAFSIEEELLVGPVFPDPIADLDVDTVSLVDVDVSTPPSEPVFEGPSIIERKEPPPLLSPEVKREAPAPVQKPDDPVNVVENFDFKARSIPLRWVEMTLREPDIVEDRNPYKHFLRKIDEHGHRWLRVVAKDGAQPGVMTAYFDRRMRSRP